MGTKHETFETLERDLDLFSIEVDGIPVWERVRKGVFRDILRQQGRDEPHTIVGTGVSDYLRGVGIWLKNMVHRNPYFVDKHDILFFGHQRRKLEEDGYWWDIYCDPIHEHGELDYAHFESPYLLSHKTPAKTENIRYLELIQYTGNIQRKLGFRTPSIPDDVITQIEDANIKIYRQFGVDVDVIEQVKRELHIRRTTLPLYEWLLERSEPDLVVIVVSYGNETLIEACKRKGIPVVELQHGIINYNHYGYSYPKGTTKFTFPDYLLTFGEFWKENIRFPIPDSHVIPVGYPYLEERLNSYDDIEPAEQLLFISQGTIGRELSQFALEVHEDDRIDHKVVYKLHPGEYDRWEDEYPWLADSGVRVIDGSEPPLYQLFAESSAQIGVRSTAVYEGLCFDLETFVFEVDGSEVLRPLIEDGAASSIETVEDLCEGIGSASENRFDRERFFKSNSVENIITALKTIRHDH